MQWQAITTPNVRNALCDVIFYKDREAKVHDSAVVLSNNKGGFCTKYGENNRKSRNLPFFGRGAEPPSTTPLGQRYLGPKGSLALFYPTSNHN